LRILKRIKDFFAWKMNKEKNRRFWKEFFKEKENNYKAIREIDETLYHYKTGLETLRRKFAMEASKVVPDYEKMKVIGQLMFRYREMIRGYEEERLYRRANLIQET